MTGATYYVVLRTRKTAGLRTTVIRFMSTKIPLLYIHSLFDLIKNFFKRYNLLIGREPSIMSSTKAFLSRSVILVAILAYLLRPINRPSFTVIEPLNPQDPINLPSGTSRRVLVAGGGLAGLSAALELAERGFQVSVWEASPVLGGRLATRTVQLCNQTFAIEHGFHAWFANYHVFADIRKRLGIDHYFRPWGAVQFIFKDPRYKPEA